MVNILYGVAGEGSGHSSYTEEDDIYNLRDRLGKRLNKTPLKRVIWK